MPHMCTGGHRTEGQIGLHGACGDISTDRYKAQTPQHSTHPPPYGAHRERGAFE